MEEESTADRDSTSSRGRVRDEAPSWTGPLHGSFGSVETDGERIRCHVCGDWFDHLIAHTLHAHGLNADEYRRAFGLAQKTKLVGPAFQAKRRRIAAEHMRKLSAEYGVKPGELSTEERRRRALKAVRREEHRLHPTEPERARFVLRAKYGADDGYPTEVLDGFARDFVDELGRGQRGVYARVGDRWGVGWPTARSRVWAAVNKGRLVWTGSDREPDGHLPGERPATPTPGSFQDRLALYRSWITETGSPHVPRGTEYQGVKLRGWLDSQRNRYQRGTLSPEQIEALEAIEGWWWTKP